MSGHMAATRPSPRRLLLPALLGLLFVGLAAPAHAVGPAAFPQAQFPAGYEAYHTYAEMVAELDAAVADHPAIVRKFSIGRSYEGRQLWAAKISDNVAVDEDEPEVLFDSLTHAREHLTVEMNLYLLNLLTDGYGNSARITGIVNSREIYLIFMLNPDGGEYDISGPEFKSWRKNRQPIPNSTRIGIDPNRNFGFNWGCCNGSSSVPRSDTYRGWAPWVAPEVAAYRDFIRSRVVGGRQQLRVAMSWHTSGELILWPYGYTTSQTVRTMTSEDRRTYKALAEAMAAMNGYTPMPSSSLYIHDGDQISWSHYEQRILHLTAEMYPAKTNFYPTAEHILAQTARNREASLYLIEMAECPYAAAGLATTMCGPLADDFETARGWQVNPSGTDTASSGRWERAIPAKTRNSGGVKQRAKVPSGQADLVTGRLAGGSATANDVDGGVTSVRSTALDLDGASAWRLFLRFTFAHDSRATSADYLRVSVIDGSARTIVWSVNGKRQNRNATWSSRTINLDAFAGRSIRLLIEAADGGTGNLVEAAVDDVRVYLGPSSSVGAGERFPAAPLAGVYAT